MAVEPKLSSSAADEQIRDALGSFRAAMGGEAPRKKAGRGLPGWANWGLGGLAVSVAGGLGCGCLIPVVLGWSAACAGLLWLTAVAWRNTWW